jgi:hypothetical protein
MKLRNIYSGENNKYICYGWSLLCRETGFEWWQIIISNRNLQPLFSKTIFNATDDYVRADAENLLATYGRDPEQPQA